MIIWAVSCKGHDRYGFSEGKCSMKGVRSLGVAVAAVAIVASTVVMAVPAYASGTTATSVTVTSNQTTLASGRAVTFFAVVSPNKVGSVATSGTMNWSIVGQDGSSVACTTTRSYPAAGKFSCMVGLANLLAAAGTYTVTASYSGDANFAPSSGSTTLPMTVGPTKLVLTLSAIPTSGAATTITATVKSGSAGPLVAGNVVFTVFAQYHSSGVALNTGGGVRCLGTATPPASNNTQALVNQVATCNLPAGWMVVKNPTTANPKPSDAWSVSATYVGNASFSASTKARRGLAKS